MTYPEVSFIVIAYNALPTIRPCILSILSQRVTSEVILVDNDSTDGTVEAVLDLPLRVIHEQLRRRGTARNRGLECARGAWIAFVDSDVELPRGWAVRALALAQAHTRVVAVGGSGLSPTAKWVSRALDALQWGRFPSSRDTLVTSLATMAALYRGDAIRGMRFADLWTGEDAEFNFRLGAKGWQFLWSGELMVVHHHPSTLGQLARKAFLYGKWFPVPYLRHPGMVTPGVVLRLLYMPVLASLAAVSLRIPAVGLAAALWLVGPLAAYALVAARLGLHSRPVAGIQFVVVHSVKQFAQMAGIWAGMFQGTWCKSP